MKKILQLALAASILFSLAACSSLSENVNIESSQELSQGGQENTSTSESEEPSAESDESDASIKPGEYTLPSGFKIYFTNNVRNDVTGRLRISTTSDSFAPGEYAVEYYKMMFSSDDEVHAIWNATFGTMTSITYSSGIVFVNTYEYVDGEEHDAKIMFSGMPLDSKMFYAETGEEFLE